MNQQPRYSVGKKLWVLLAATLTLGTTNVKAQYYDSDKFVELGFTIGGSNLLSDLGGTGGKGMTFLKDNNFPATRLAGGVFATYHPVNFLGFRASFNYGRYYADDNLIKAKGGLEQARIARNNNVRTSIADASVMAIFYPTAIFIRAGEDMTGSFQPFVSAGVGFFKFNPHGQDPLTGDWVALQPLRTEGQGLIPGRDPYKLSGVSIPLGFGFKYYISQTFTVSGEVIYRKTFTDYIDDVSTTYVDPSIYATAPMNGSQRALAQRMSNKSVDIHGNGPLYAPGSKRGTETNNDAFYTVGITFGWRFGGGLNPWKNSTKCPVRF
jgi:hypothetical protein